MNAEDDHWVNIQADDRPIDEIHSEILERVVRYINEDNLSDFARIESALFQNTSGSCTV